MKICFLSYKAVVIFLVLSNFSAIFAEKSTSSNSEISFQPQIKREDSLKSLRALENDIEKIIEGADLKGARFSVAVYSLDTKNYLFRKNVGDMLTPASVTKLFTCFSAYYKLGKDFKVKTTIYTDGDVKNGVVEGNLYIKGHGDALFSSADLNSLVEQLKKSGIKSVTGSIYGDGTYFDEITDRFRYSGDKDAVQGLQQITGLSIDENIVTVQVRGSSNGRPVSVDLIPSSDAFKLSVSAKTFGGSRVAPAPQKTARKGVQGHTNRKHRYADNNIIEMEPGLNDKGFGGPLLAQRKGAGRRVESRAGIGVSVKNLPEGNQQIVVSGSLDADKSYIYKHHIQKPDLAAAGALKNRLTASGIEVKGTYGVKTYEEYSKIKNKNQLAEFDRDMPDIISPLMKHSDNYLAENIFKIVGASGKLRNNAKEATLYISSVLDSIHVQCEDCIFNDGSGLSRRNKVNTSTIVKLLEYSAKSSFGKSFDTTFSIAGIDGTLKNRMTNTLAENNVHAKTGTHGNVSALAGYVKTLDGERLAFAFVFNGYNVGYYKSIENEIGKLLAQFFYFNVEK